MKRVCVPVYSPAWKHYIDEGWITVQVHGNWATLIHPLLRYEKSPESYDYSTTV